MRFIGSSSAFPRYFRRCSHRVSASPQIPSRHLDYLGNTCAVPADHTIWNVGKSPLQHASKWTAAACAVVCAQVLLSLLAPRGFALTAFGDILQDLILLCAMGAVFSNVRQAAPKARLFWTLLGLGLGMWLDGVLMVSYREVDMCHVRR